MRLSKKMLNISLSGPGHLFNHSDIEALNIECEKLSISIDFNLKSYFVTKDISLIKDSDVLFITNFDVFLQNKDNVILLENLRSDYPTKFILGYAQEVPHYQHIYDTNKHFLNYSLGMAHEKRVNTENYSYFPFPMPFKHNYELCANRNHKQILLSGAFRLARAQLYYQLMSETELDCRLFYTKNRPNSTQYEGADSTYPVNFYEKFADKVLISHDNTYKDYIKALSKSQIIVNYSRQITNLEAFHSSIKHNMAKAAHKTDFEFMSTRVRECALAKTMCISNYDQIYSMSGLEENISIATYTSYQDLVDKLKIFTNDPMLCKNIGLNLYNHYNKYYTDVHLIKKIKDICS
jgi:hypothetical protein